MSMSIGQLLKGLAGDAQPGEGKALELKVGQTVRGVLVKMTGDEEGIVQINGTSVLAKLETPMSPGQAMLLQVQPESGEGALVLKQAEPKSAAAAEASVKAWIKALGLPDTKASAELVGALRKDGVVLTRELAGQFKAALAAMPAGGDAQTWMRAAALAAKRGLPMTGATIGALQQVIAGPPAHALLEALEAGLAAWRGTGAAAGQAAAGGSASQPQGAAQAAAAKLHALLSEGAALMRAGGGGEQPPVGAAGARGTAAEPVARGAAGAAAALAARSAAAPAPGAGGAGAGAGPAGAQQAAASAPAGAGLAQAAGADDAVQAPAGSGVAQAGGTPQRQSGAQAAAGAGMQASSMDGELDAVSQQPNARQLNAQPANALPGNERSMHAAAGRLPNGSQLSGNADQAEQLRLLAAAANNRQASQTASAQTVQPDAQDAANGNWVKQVMKWMGVDHERLLAVAVLKDSSSADIAKPPVRQTPVIANEAADARQDGQSHGTKTAVEHDSAGNGVLARNAAAALQAASTTPFGQAPAAIAGDDGWIHPSESMKSALLTIAASDEAPQQLRDTAQQLVAQITGQQLLLSPEKNGALFSHVTMFIPMKGQDGNQTASVHIQTRRGRKGELDGENCRLVFDLRMKNLGDTVIDVQVINKIVNLHVWNDHPATAQLVEAARDELNTAMSNAGYQLLTLRVEDMPERIAERLNGQSGLAATADGQAWSTNAYKGVDLRV
ncbi:flagellar hook-length control protein FliK [Paenibacillus lycopersici]|uniref:Flagellar hook-length control protein FliK n=1 Tax=Paenibacillus lycopersici TaxID=2704462 RepID=A0A6C0FX58_9BACL|nr:flagellar hook-length control protein FliK [Paenibacillus lycopersici]QHT60632.1 flagellar hook-length control protein FliK [Paenibacillus lycopersici]